MLTHAHTHTHHRLASRLVIHFFDHKRTYRLELQSIKCIRCPSLAFCCFQSCFSPPSLCLSCPFPPSFSHPPSLILLLSSSLSVSLPHPPLFSSPLFSLSSPPLSSSFSPPPSLLPPLFFSPSPPAFLSPSFLSLSLSLSL